MQNDVSSGSEEETTSLKDEDMSWQEKENKAEEQQLQALHQRLSLTARSVQTRLVTACAKGDLKGLRQLFASHPFVLGQLSADGQLEKHLLEGCLKRRADPESLALLDAYFKEELGGSYFVGIATNRSHFDSKAIWYVLCELERDRWWCGNHKPYLEEEDLEAFIRIVTHLSSSSQQQQQQQHQQQQRQHEPFPILQATINGVCRRTSHIATYTALVVVRMLVLKKGRGGEELDQFMRHFMFPGEDGQRGGEGEPYQRQNVVNLMLRRLVDAMHRALPPGVAKEKAAPWMEKIMKEMEADLAFKRRMAIMGHTRVQEEEQEDEEGSDEEMHSMYGILGELTFRDGASAAAQAAVSDEHEKRQENKRKQGR
jgi:hypothetical protein